MLNPSLADGFIAYEDTTTVPSLVKTAEGKILELGPGPGNQIHRYDQSLVEFIYAIEPNHNFKDDIAAKVKNHDLQDRYKLISCGVEDSDILRREGITEGSVDTVRRARCSNARQVRLRARLDTSSEKIEHCSLLATFITRHRHSPYHWPVWSVCFFHSFYLLNK